MGRALGGLRGATPEAISSQTHPYGCHFGDSAAASVAVGARAVALEADVAGELLVAGWADVALPCEAEGVVHDGWY